MKVKILNSSTPGKLETYINEFIENKVIEDVKVDLVLTENGRSTWVGVVTY